MTVGAGSECGIGLYIAGRLYNLLCRSEGSCLRRLARYLFRTIGDTLSRHGAGRDGASSIAYHRRHAGVEANASSSDAWHWRVA